MIGPFFEISSLKEFTNEAKETSIVNVLCQRVEQNLMIQAVKAGFDISVG
jgi:hypothetical protein